MRESSAIFVRENEIGLRLSCMMRRRALHRLRRRYMRKWRNWNVLCSLALKPKLKRQLWNGPMMLPCLLIRRFKRCVTAIALWMILPTLGIFRSRNSWSYYGLNFKRTKGPWISCVYRTLIAPIRIVALSSYSNKFILEDIVRCRHEMRLLRLEGWIQKKWWKRNMFFHHWRNFEKSWVAFKIVVKPHRTIWETLSLKNFRNWVCICAVRPFSPCKYCVTGFLLPSSRVLVGVRVPAPSIMFFLNCLIASLTQ